MHMTQIKYFHLALNIYQFVFKIPLQAWEQHFIFTKIKLAFRSQCKYGINTIV